jgi:hypothetical protein
MKLTKDSSKVNWYPGTSKEACDQGYEKLDATADERMFRANEQSPREQGWRDAPMPTEPRYN